MEDQTQTAKQTSWGTIAVIITAVIAISAGLYFSSTSPEKPTKIIEAPVAIVEAEIIPEPEVVEPEVVIPVVKPEPVIEAPELILPNLDESEAWVQE